ncbi:MAG: hypothetical protein WBN22_15045 [Verrucomicrobiia bacterium]
MPVLYQYVNQNGYYIKTCIAGEVKVFQVSQSGAHKIRALSFRPGDTFSRDILVRLWVDGDAYTGQAGPHASTEDTNLQVEFDFAEDMISESPFPVCDCDSSLEKLSLVIVTPPNKICKGEIACEVCLAAYGIATDLVTTLYIRRENNLNIALRLSQLDHRNKTKNALKLEFLLQGIILPR